MKNVIDYIITYLSLLFGSDEFVKYRYIFLFDYSKFTILNLG